MDCDIPAGSLREQRRALGLSQQRLAEQAQVSIGIVRLLEGGYRPGKSAALARIESILAAPAQP